MQLAGAGNEITATITTAIRCKCSQLTEWRYGYDAQRKRVKPKRTNSSYACCIYLMRYTHLTVEIIKKRT